VRADTRRIWPYTDVQTRAECSHPTPAPPANAPAPSRTWEAGAFSFLIGSCSPSLEHSPTVRNRPVDIPVGEQVVPIAVEDVVVLIPPLAGNAGDIGAAKDQGVHGTTSISERIQMVKRRGAAQEQSLRLEISRRNGCISSKDSMRSP
jgi:hypothetical protein